MTSSSTPTDLASAPPASPTAGKDSAFQTLLARQPKVPAESPSPAKVEGIAMGRIEHVDASNGTVRVGIASLGLQGLNAVSMVQLTPLHVGQSVALGFEGGQTSRPVVLGLMMRPVSTDGGTDTKDEPDDVKVGTAPSGTAPTLVQARNALQVSQDGRRVVIEAQTELELRCGEAVILLSEDGHVQIRGAYVTSHATASQRIRGGSVQIN